MDTRKIPPTETPAEYLAREFYEAFKAQPTSDMLYSSWSSVPPPTQRRYIGAAQELIDRKVIQLLPPDEGPDFTGVTPEMRAEMKRVQADLNNKES